GSLPAIPFAAHDRLDLVDRRTDRAVRRALRAESLARLDAVRQQHAVRPERPSVRRRHLVLRLRVSVLALPARGRFHHGRVLPAWRVGPALSVRWGAAAGRRRAHDLGGAGPPYR